MKITAAVAACGLAVLAAGCGTSTRALAPPPGLSEYGRVLWNFEALLHARYGSQPVCSRPLTSPSGFDWTPAACNLPAPLQVDYRPVFADASHSSFRLIPRPSIPPLMGQTVPIEVDNQYVLCSRTGKTILVALDPADWACRPTP